MVGLDSALLAGILSAEVAQVLVVYRLQRRVSRLEAVVGMLADRPALFDDEVPEP